MVIRIALAVAGDAIAGDATARGLNNEAGKSAKLTMTKLAI
jgi:hypothetical protein